MFALTSLLARIRNKRDELKSHSRGVQESVLNDTVPPAGHQLAGRALRVASRPAIDDGRQLSTGVPDARLIDINP